MRWTGTRVSACTMQLIECHDCANQLQTPRYDVARAPYWSTPRTGRFCGGKQVKMQRGGTLMY